MFGIPLFTLWSATHVFYPDVWIDSHQMPDELFFVHGRQDDISSFLEPDSYPVE